MESERYLLNYLGLESVSIRRIQCIGYGILGFLGVGTTFDIFQNIHILYLQYGVLVFSGYDVLIMFPLWSLANAGTDTPYLPTWIRRIGCQNRQWVGGSSGGVWNDIVRNGEEIDGTRWILGEDGEFTVKELTRLVEEKILRVESGGQETLWNKLVPKKVNNFV
ncbi:hypothetical protein Tco_1151153 [Tanacetum coccineum]